MSSFKETHRRVTDMEMEGEGSRNKVVAVTGASGFIASWLVKMLLKRGYTVKASLRDPSDVKKTEHLLSLNGAKERLQLFRSNLLEEGSFDAIVDGCVGVFHTASPVIFSTHNPKADLLDPAVKGTLNVLKSCTKFKSIKRVVLTSSLASVELNTDMKPDVVIDETWFADPKYCEARKMWYPLSKVLAEEEAWKCCMENKMDLVVINPGTVWGPMIQPSVNPSLSVLLNLVNGSSEAYPDRSITCVDVRDVAYAHILAFEVTSANGRYILVGSHLHCSQIVNTLAQLFPTLQLPTKSVPSPLAFPNRTVLNEKAKRLGINFIPLEVTLKDTVESFNDKNLISFFKSM